MANTVSAIRAVKKIKKRTQVNKIRVGKYKAAVKTIEEELICSWRSNDCICSTYCTSPRAINCCDAWC